MCFTQFYWYYPGLGRAVSNKASLERNPISLSSLSCSYFAVCCRANMEKDFTSIEFSIITSDLSTVSTSDTMHTEPFTSVGKTPYLLAQVYIAMKSM